MEATKHKNIPQRRSGPWCSYRLPYSRSLDAPPPSAASAVVPPWT